MSTHTEDNDLCDHEDDDDAAYGNTDYVGEFIIIGLVGVIIIAVLAYAVCSAVAGGISV